MAVPIPPGSAVASIEFTLDNYPRKAYTTFGVGFIGTNQDGDWIAGQLLGAWNLAFGPIYDNNVQFTRCRLAIGQDATDPMLGEFAATYRGQSNLNSVSPALAVLVNKRTGYSGRRNRGRMFLPWAIGEEGVSETGTITGAWVQTLQDACNDFLETLNDPTDPLEGISGMRLLHGVGLGPPTPVTGLTVSSIISTQRRRQVR